MLGLDYFFQSGAPQEGPAWEAELKAAQEKWDQRDEAQPKPIIHPV